MEDPGFGKEDYVNKLVSFLQQGGTVQEMYQMSDADMEVMYVAASRYLKQQKYTEASDSYLFLTFLNPYQARFWLGLGESLKLNQEPKEAIEAYTMAILNDGEDPRPYYHISSCHLSLNEPQEALDRLLTCVEQARGKPEFDALREISYELIDDLTHRIAESEGE